LGIEIIDRTHVIHDNQSGGIVMDKNIVVYTSNT